MATPHDPNKLTRFQITMYGLGDAGFNILFVGLGIYLLRYYTDVLGISPLVAGAMVSGPVIWDAISDPIMGWIATRTNTKWGRYRPYILISGPFMALSFVAMFASPLLLPQAIITLSVISHVLFRTFFTVGFIPYMSLSANLTNDSATRSYLAMSRLLFTTAAGVASGSLTFFMVQRLGGDSLVLGYFYVSLIFAAVSVAILIPVFFVTKENTSNTEAIYPTTISDTWKFLRRNLAFWILALGIAISGIQSGVSGNSMTYYVTYVLDLPEGLSVDDAVGIVYGSLLIALVFSYGVWGWAASKSKRNTWMFGTVSAGIVCLVGYFIFPRDIILFASLFVISGLLVGATPIAILSMMPDTVEYGEWRSGFRDEAIVFALLQLASKMATGIGIALVGVTLSAIGYVANQPQTEEAIQGLRFIIFLFPFFTSIVTAGLIYLYPITGSLHLRIVKAITWQQTRRSQRLQNERSVRP